MPGVDPAVNPRLARKAGELAAWVDYLLRPESNDGPRIYRPKHPGTGPDAKDFESPYRMPPADRDAPYENPAEYETVSVFEEFAGDPDVFFRAATAVCGVSTEVMTGAFDHLTKGCITYGDEDTPRMPEREREDTDKEQQPLPAPEIQYRELHPARLNWLGMRKSWVAVEDVCAHQYEQDFLDYQIYTENAVYTIAEHVVRYRAIMHKAGEDVLALMEAMVDLCPKPAPPGEGSFNLLSIIVTGLVAASTTVLTGGAATTIGVLLGATAIEVAGEAAKTAERSPSKKELKLDNQYYLRDVAKQYVGEVEKIEREVAQAVRELAANLRDRLEVLRQEREYRTLPNSGRRTRDVPRYAEYQEAAAGFR